MKAQKCFWFSILPNVLFVYELGPFNLNLKFKSPTGEAVTVTRDRPKVTHMAHPASAPPAAKPTLEEARSITTE